LINKLIKVEVAARTAVGAEDKERSVVAASNCTELDGEDSKVKRHRKYLACKGIR
jgi:hypothetical protein